MLFDGYAEHWTNQESKENARNQAKGVYPKTSDYSSAFAWRPDSNSPGLKNPRWDSPEWSLKILNFNGHEKGIGRGFTPIYDFFQVAWSIDIRYLDSGTHDPILLNDVFCLMDSRNHSKAFKVRPVLNSEKYFPDAFCWKWAFDWAGNLNCRIGHGSNLRIKIGKGKSERLATAHWRSLFSLPSYPQHLWNRTSALFLLMFFSMIWFWYEESEKWRTRKGSAKRSLWISHSSA